MKDHQIKKYLACAKKYVNSKIGRKVPKPRNKLGYSSTELESFMTETELKKFNKWIRGQTCAIVNRTILYYPWDVQRYLDSVREGKLTYWD